mmetsp:Transcript_14919/g.19350  ORF Transcript_14919/g.19350 Transcript_14919/m.19350 type:complete len:126 (+) Transcript_14919:775-1152(+)
MCVYVKGPIPACFGDSLTKLEYLGLAKNHLSGPIPNSIGSLQRLSNLALYDNLISGVLPAAMRNLTNLNSLVLWENRLSGVADGLELKYWRLLQTINLTNNQLEEKDELRHYLEKHLPGSCQVYV